MKTYQPKARDIRRDWNLVDAEGKVLGRMASNIAIMLMGKHKPNYSGHMDVGDFVVVINAKDVKLTGKKLQRKTYKSHSGYPGGFREVKLSKLMVEHPEKVISHAVAGMLPENRLKSRRMARLKIFAFSDHPYKDKFKDK